MTVGYGRGDGPCSLDLEQSGVAVTPSGDLGRCKKIETQNGSWQE